MMKLTACQIRTIHAIKELSATGSSPTADEIAAKVGTSVSAVRQHLLQLQLKGYLKPRPHQSHRTIALTEEALAA